MESLAPVYTADLFLPLHAELIALLRDLDRSIQTADLVDQPEAARLMAGPDPALRDGVDLVGRLLSSLGHA